MAATWTKAGQVRRTFKAGRPLKKDRVVPPTIAIYEACILLDELRTAMHDAGLSPDDVRAALVLMTPETPGKENLLYLLRIPEPGKLPKLFATVEEIEESGKILTLGILVRQEDREASDPKDGKVRVAVWPQPFLTGDRATRALKQAGQMFMDGSGGKSTFN